MSITNSCLLLLTVFQLRHIQPQPRDPGGYASSTQISVYCALLSPCRSRRTRRPRPLLPRLERVLRACPNAAIPFQTHCRNQFCISPRTNQSGGDVRFSVHGGRQRDSQNFIQELWIARLFHDRLSTSQSPNRGTPAFQFFPPLYY